MAVSDPQPNGQPTGRRPDLRITFDPPGTYVLTIGGTVLELPEEDLARLGRAIHVMAGRHPTLLARLIAAALHEQPEGPQEDRPP